MFDYEKLIALVGVSSMTISYYESSERKPCADTMNVHAKILRVKVTDFLSNRNENLVFANGEFRKGSNLSVKQQEYIKEFWFI